jgi:hypothetical protein
VGSGQAWRGEVQTRLPSHESTSHDHVTEPQEAKLDLCELVPLDYLDRVSAQFHAEIPQANLPSLVLAHYVVPQRVECLLSRDDTLAQPLDRVGTFGRVLLSTNDDTRMARHGDRPGHRMDVHVTRDAELASQPPLDT